MFFYITIQAKEKTTLQKFLIFLSKVDDFSFNFFSQKQKKNKHKFLTILKSPHINKTAQEQFEYKCFTSEIVLYSTNLFFCFTIFKCILKKGFPGLKIKLLYSFDKKKQNRFLLTFLNPNNISSFNKTTRRKKIKSYFFMFDSFGEISLQNFKTKKYIFNSFRCIFSSVG